MENGNLGSFEGRAETAPATATVAPLAAAAVPRTEPPVILERMECPFIAWNPTAPT